jgi:hypothetical protein
MEQRDWSSTVDVRLHNNALGNTQKSHRIQNCKSKGIIKEPALKCG